MKRYLWLIGLWLIDLWSGILLGNERPCFTNNNSGRIGNILLAYSKARWLAKTYEMPCYYQVPKQMEEVEIVVEGARFPKYFRRAKKRETLVQYPQEIRPIKKNLKEVHCAYAFKKRVYGTEHGDISYFKGLLSDARLRDELRRDIHPCAAVQTIEVPEERLGVAVHIRSGSGDDTSRLSPDFYDVNTFDEIEYQKNVDFDKTQDGGRLDISYPLMAPPLQYYLDQITVLYELLERQPLYVFVYTDAKNPASIVAMLQKRLEGDIVIASRIAHHYSKTAVDDLFEMAQYDYLIRSCSTFAQFAQIIGRHKIIICPRYCAWNGHHLVITDTTITDHYGNEIHCK